MTPTIASLERMTAEDCDTAVQRYLLEPLPADAVAGAALLHARATFCTQLRDRKLWPHLYRSAR
jgi:hypothetical protein